MMGGMVWRTSANRSNTWRQNKYVVWDSQNSLRTTFTATQNLRHCVSGHWQGNVAEIRKKKSVLRRTFLPTFVPWCRWSKPSPCLHDWDRPPLHWRWSPGAGATEGCQTGTWSRRSGWLCQRLGAGQTSRGARGWAACWWSPCRRTGDRRGGCNMWLRWTI